MSNPYRSDVAVDELATELGVELPALVRPDTERCLRRLATVAGVDLPSILFAGNARRYYVFDWRRRSSAPALYCLDDA